MWGTHTYVDTWLDTELYTRYYAIVTFLEKPLS